MFAMLLQKCGREATMEEQKTEHQNYITGYLHNVSPILTSNKTKYFDMQIQTGEDEVKRGVCFSPPRIDEFNKHSESKSPVKISKFRLDKSTTSVCMGPDVQLSQVDKLDFERKTLPQTLNLSLLNSVFDGQLISIKAKLINLTAAKKFSSTKSAALNKSEADLLDPHGSVRLTLWGDFTSQVTEGKTYHFTNLRVRKDTYNNNIHLNTAKTGCVIVEAVPFDEPLCITNTLPLTSTSTSIQATILGINNSSQYLSCCNCNKKISSLETKIVECASCGLKQRPASCKKHWYLQGLFQHEKGTINLTFFDDTLKQILGSDANLESTTDIGCKGNLLLDRMVGSHVIVVPPLQYKSGLKQMMEKMAEKFLLNCGFTQEKKGDGVAQDQHKHSADGPAAADEVQTKNKKYMTCMLQRKR
ncbi:hypothetical protein ACROYT_G027863 [Oculina patagonica]